MTLVVATAVNEGIVIGADSRATYIDPKTKQPRIGTDYAEKLFDVKGFAVGTAGAGHLMALTISQHMEELKAGLPSQPLSFDDVCRRVAVHFSGVHAQTIADLKARGVTLLDGDLDVYFLVAGYDKKKPRIDRILIHAPVPKAPMGFTQVTQVAPGFVSPAWIGASEVCERLLNGYAHSTFVPGSIPANLDSALRNSAVAIPYPLYKLQDAMNLTSFLFECTMFIQRAQVSRDWVGQEHSNVGGFIEYATVTPAGFDWKVRKKVEVRQTLLAPPSLSG